MSLFKKIFTERPNKTYEHFLRFLMVKNTDEVMIHLNKYPHFSQNSYAENQNCLRWDNDGYRYLTPLLFAVQNLEGVEPKAAVIFEALVKNGGCIFEKITVSLESSAFESFVVQIITNPKLLDDVNIQRMVKLCFDQMHSRALELKDTLPPNMYIDIQIKAPQLWEQWSAYQQKNVLLSEIGIRDCANTQNVN